MAKLKKKKGALTPEECVQKATSLIADHGICLFLVDIVGSRIGDIPERTQRYHALASFVEELNIKFAEFFPENQLAVGKFRAEKGFSFSLGDATWTGINDPSVIPAIIAYKDSAYPDLKLHYGVSKDGWSDGIELVK